MDHIYAQTLAAALEAARVAFPEGASDATILVLGQPLPAGVYLIPSVSNNRGPTLHNWLLARGGSLSNVTRKAILGGGSGGRGGRMQLFNLASPAPAAPRGRGSRKAPATPAAEPVPAETAPAQPDSNS